jgi:hypothetical protein
LLNKAIYKVAFIGGSMVKNLFSSALVLVSLAILIVGVVVLLSSSGAGAPPPPGGGPPPPPPAAVGGAVGPVGITGDGVSYYPLQGWYGRNLRVLQVQDGEMVLAERVFPDNLFPIWAGDPSRAEWLVWPSSVACPVNFCSFRVGEIVDIAGVILQDDTLLATYVRVVMGSSS